MKPKNTVGTTIFYLMIFVVVGVLLILFGINMITEEGFAGPFLLLFLVGGLFIFAGIFATISTIKNRPDRNNLKKTGQKCSGVIIRVTLDYSTTLNGRHPQMAVCHVVDSYSGEPFEVTSTAYMSDLNRFLMREVDVYIDRYDRSKYFVDIEALVGGYNNIPDQSGTIDFRR